MMATRKTSVTPTAAPRPEAAGLDMSVAHPARRYNYWLGGKDNFAADRASGDAIAAVFPHIRTAARENRAFLQRAVHHLAAEHGVRQFLDIGAGLPTADNTHQIAQRVDPTARIVYVDNDPLVLAHARALLTGDPAGATAYLDADVRHPDQITTSPEVTSTLDLTRPVGVLMVALMHFVADDAQAQAAVQTVMQAMPAGSWLVLSHATADLLDPAVATQFAGQPAAGFTGRRREQVRAFFAGLDLTPPNLAVVSDWRRNPDDTPPPASEVSVWGGVARKPSTAAEPA